MCDPVPAGKANCPGALDVRRWEALQEGVLQHAPALFLMDSGQHFSRAINRKFSPFSQRTLQVGKGPPYGR